MAARKTTGAVKSAPEKETEAAEAVSAPVEHNPNTSVIVRNGFRGTLVYTSQRTGETYKWDQFGDEQEMELRELRNVKSSAKGFFENNWFLFDKEYDWVLDELKVRQFYKNALRVDDFDELFSMEPSDVAKKVASLTGGQKRAVAFRAQELVRENKIDSLGVIRALQDALGITLIGE